MKDEVKVTPEEQLIKVETKAGENVSMSTVSVEAKRACTIQYIESPHA